jgi:hypothetical protein
MKRKIMTTSVLTIALCIALSSFAYAHFFGGKWNSSIGWWLSSSSPYYSTFQSAASSWNNWSKLKFCQTSMTSATVIPAIEFYGYLGWAGQGVPGPNQNSGTYTYGEVRINRSYTDPSSANIKTAVVTHELGHILGLAHPYTANDPSIMYSNTSYAYNTWGIYYPAGHDITDINTLYP